MRFLALLKFIIIASLLAAGIVFLLKGLGVELPVLKYQTAEAQNVPAGIVLLLVAIAIARFWRIEIVSTTTTTKKETVNPDGAKTSEKETTSEIRFMPSDGPRPTFDDIPPGPPPPR